MQEATPCFREQRSRSSPHVQACAQHSFRKLRMTLSFYIFLSTVQWCDADRLDVLYERRVRRTILTRGPGRMEWPF